MRSLVSYAKHAVESRSGLGVLVLAVGIVATSVLPGSAQQAAPARPSAMSSADEIQRFCTNIADPARDQRYLLQKQDLEKLQADVNDRIAVLEKRKSEYQDWLARRNDFLQKAEAGLTDVYKNMKPDAAAPQLEKVNPLLAAAIIMKLPAKQSSLILSEMDPAKAAIVAGIMSNAADPTTSKEPT
ncbi:MotE family protein [Allorhizobium taibaishanense]|uniref:Flagellar motility protein MotE (MotC chaperone) n=1 Tax=Allorhizobium taibaishanense TaxID=887144 RepID=A0A1Q9ABV4_9HYPH|nr:MotE family protein [Allorhizobium taibaishanense]MBB4010226.1 flagellar motility protein MotE (MotC chaperone) [Allorhizobium taibaishanense]OLP52343.1 flagellar protein [Allorhizobium taibaishanense]